MAHQAVIFVHFDITDCATHLSQTISGHRAGTVAWSGLANSFYFIDRKTGIGGVIIAQLLPWMDPQMHKLRDEFGTWIYESFVD